MNTAEQLPRKQLLPATNENVRIANDMIISMAFRRQLVISPKINLNGIVPDMPTRTKEKKFRKRMNRVIKHCTMRAANSFLRYFGDARVEYSEREQKIREARKKFIDLRKQMIDARTAYLVEKAEFYGGKLKLPIEMYKKA